MAGNRIGIFGAGMIGRFLGIHLSAAGCPVTMIGRSVDASVRMEAVRHDGRIALGGRELVLTDDPRTLREVDLCLVTVKHKDTTTAAQTLASVLRPDALVVSFQNGLNAAEVLRRRLVQPVSAGVVTFNVHGRDDGRVRQTTRGMAFAERLLGSSGERMKTLQRSFHAAGLRLQLRDDMPRVLAGKLLLNLNNGVCAATGLGIAESIASSSARWCFAEAIREGLLVMRAAGLRPARVGPLSPSVMAHVLHLPDILVHRIARGLTSVGGEARSSTLQDLERGQTTEIEQLNGAIVRLAERVDEVAPVNRTIAQIVHRHERAALAHEPIHFVSADALRRACERAQLDAPPRGRGRAMLPPDRRQRGSNHTWRTS